ncbi:oxidoreductase, short chain dehydrogenase/reductase family [Paecilomyces variotii No. 5]|uniref:Oxidoreductase, short chain dehydrogenase/reductase family n=1 Tax=Byssochlamys spectabilis (strain No. 5 / NBRC 109023) TaxID=1356009 RepID=V5FA18_BYSSN|nr:oxidoreductase, short chain dehydrogenase/reductase family [Paecilomyces variotii No. 5]
MAAKAFAIVAGVGSGTGASVARKFAKSYPVVLLSRNPASYEPIVEEINASGGKAIGLSADLADFKSVQSTFDKIGKEFPSALLAAAIFNPGGGFVRKPFLELTEEEFLSGFESQGKGAFNFSKATLPLLLKATSLEHPPSLIFTGATASVRGSANCASFASGKFALRALSQSLAREFGPQGVHVSHVIVDGVIDIPRTKSWKFDHPDAKLSPDAVNCGFILVFAHPTQNDVRIRIRFASWATLTLNYIRILIINYLLLPDPTKSLICFTAKRTPSLLSDTMVLDDASPQADGFQSDNGSSDAFDRPVDPNSPFSRFYPLQIREELIYKPGLLSMYLTFFGQRNWERRFSEHLTERYENMKLGVQRNPTQEEFDCFVETSSRGLYQSRLGLPLGVAAGVAHSLYQVRDVKDSQGRIDFSSIANNFRALAKADPNFMRGFIVASSLKLFGWSVVGLTISSVYATFKSTTAMLADPRLERLREELRQQKPEDIRKRRIEHANSRYQEAQRTKQGMTQGAFAETQEQQGNESESSSDSPSTYYGTGTTDSRESIPIPSQPDRRIYSDQATTATSKTGGSDFFDDDDDASPTNPDYRMDGSSSSGVIGGNTWERIRQQNMSSSVQQQQRPQQTYRAPQQPNQTSSAGYDSYSSEESRRQRERELAQREFDRMIESERKSGEDSPSTSGQKSRWGSWR